MTKQNSNQEEGKNTNGRYNVHAICRNCGYKGDISIEISVQVTEVRCPTCGCDTLVRWELS